MIKIQSTSSASQSRLISRRMFVMTLAQAVVFAGIFGRLVSLQINENKKYRTLSDKNRFREWKVAPKRGVIKDFFNKEIASNTRVYQLHLTPENTSDIEVLFYRLKKILNLEEKKINYIRKKMAKQKPWEPIILSDNLTWAEFSRVNLFLHELEGVKPVVSVARLYNEKSTSHVVGYVSQVSAKDLKNKDYLKEMSVTGIAVGKTGLESNLDKDIIGKVGFQRYEVNAFGKRIKQIKIDKGEEGKNFQTTIDLEVQKFASEQLSNVVGAACVMDIYSGDIITMASSPTYDPNLFVHGVNKDEWNKLLSNENKPLMNKAISGLYPPGSTIKTIVALSALENNVASPSLTVRCKGVTELYGEKFHCWKKKGHGYMTMRSAIQKSCDVYFYEIARRLGVDKLSVTAKKFGLGNRVLEGFIEEKSGVVPNTKWKKKNIGQNWYLGETLHSGIGQGYYLSTPLQLCLMTAQIANGGYKIKPQIVFNSGKNKNDLKNFVNNQKNKNLNINLPFNELLNPNIKPLFRNKENISFIKDAMFAATNEPGGTSYKSRFRNKKFIFAGKTGSSQIKRFTQEQRENEVKQNEIVYKDRDHALFVAFAPVHKPQYAISVLVEHGGSGSSSAAPLAKNIIKKVIERDSKRQLKNNKIFENIT